MWDKVIPNKGDQCKPQYLAGASQRERLPPGELVHVYGHIRCAHTTNKVHVPTFSFCSNLSIHTQIWIISGDRGKHHREFKITIEIHVQSLLHKYHRSRVPFQLAFGLLALSERESSSSHCLLPRHVFGGLVADTTTTDTGSVHVPNRCSATTAVSLWCNSFQ